MLAALSLSASPSPALALSSPPAPSDAAERKPSSPTRLQDGDDDEDDEGEDIEDLLYAAQMDLISHRTPEAMHKLQRAVDLGSSGAAASLANLLIRVDPTPLTSMPTSLSPDALNPLAPPPVSSTSTSTRPTLPARQPSNLFAHAAHSHRKTDESLRATDLYLRGLEVELKKPVQDELIRGEEVVESGYASGSDEEYSAEGRFFSLERALDLVVGVTDSHRFGILHAPATSSTKEMSSPKEGKQPADDRNDELWARSAITAAALLRHPLIAPIVEEASSLPFVDVTATGAQTPRPSSRRRSSTARSYTHAASSIPEAPRPSGLPAAFPIPPHLTPNRKLQLTIAIHALYTLALQAHSSSPSSSSHHPHPSAAPSPPAESYWIAITRLASPYAPLGGIGIKEGDELVTRAQHRLDSLRHQDQGANEPWRLAKHAKKRDGAIAAPPVPPPVAGRRRGNSLIVEQGKVWEGEPASVMTIRPSARRGPSSGSDAAGAFVEEATPRTASGGGKFHFASSTEDDLAEQDEQDASAAAAGDSAFTTSSPPTSLLISPPSAASSRSINGGGGGSGSTAAARLAASQKYPSPPETPPLETGLSFFAPPPVSPQTDGLVPPASGSTAVTAKKPSSSLSPLSATAPVFVPSSSSSSSAARSPVTPSTTTSTSASASASASAAALPRAPSTYSLASSYRSTGGTSILSTFSYNPLQAYLSGRSIRHGGHGLKRVTSSTSVCTAPPDFERAGARRFSRADKGKGRAIAVEPSSGFTSPTAATARAPLSALESPAASATPAPKTWLSRFWATTKGAVVDLKEGAGGGADGFNALERTRSSSAVVELQRALERHEEACEVALSYWGEREFYEDDEEVEELEGENGSGEAGEGSTEEEQEVLAPVSPPLPRRGASERTIRPSPPDVTFVDGLTNARELRQPPLKRRNTKDSLKNGNGNGNNSSSGSIKSAKSKRSFLLGDPTHAHTTTTSSSASRRTSSRRNHKRAISSTSSINSFATTIIDGHLAPPSPSSPKPVPIDPLLLELERRSHVGIKTVCGACHKKGLNFPACRKCKKTYCSRECRVSGRHPCQAVKMAAAANGAAAAAPGAVEVVA